MLDQGEAEKIYWNAATKTEEGLALAIMEHDRAAQVKEWMAAFGQATPDKPEMPDLETRKLRVKLIAEELLELCDAFGVALYITRRRDETGVYLYECAVDELSDSAPDLVLAADALSDLDVVVTGGHVACGLPQQALLDENMRANMSKLGPDGKPIYRDDGKVMKGPNYAPPDFEAVLARKAESPPLMSTAEPPMPELPSIPKDVEARMIEAHWRRALIDVGDAISRLGTLMAQGYREDSPFQAGQISTLLRSAAERIVTGRAPELDPDK